MVLACQCIGSVAVCEMAHEEIVGETEHYRKHKMLNRN